MNISSLSVNKFYSVSSIKNTKIATCNRQSVSDCFVKSNSVSFSSLQGKEQREKNVDIFIKDLGGKVSSPKFSINDISNSMKKYVKNITVKPMSQAPRNLLFSDSLQGLYRANLNFNESNNRFFYPQKNRTLYVQTETLKKPYGKLEVFTNSAHEYTHVLQIEDDNANPIGIFNRYIEQHRDDVSGALKQIELVTSAVNKIEEAVARPFINLLIENEDLSYERLERGQTDFVSWLCRKNKTEDFSSYVREKVSSVIDEIGTDVSIDRTLLCDVTINHFEREIEAYNSENRAHQMVLGISNTRAMTRVQIYQKSIDALNEMKKEVE